METTSVRIEVAPLTSVRGCGKLRYVTFVTLTVADIDLVLQGVGIAEDKRGVLTVTPPQTKHPSTGVWYTCVGLPPELWRAVEIAALQLVPDASRVVVTAPPAEAA